MEEKIINIKDCLGNCYYEPYLFPETEITSDGWQTSVSTSMSASKYESNGTMNIELFRHLSYTGTYQMPMVKPYNGKIPEFLIPNYRLSRRTMTCGVCPCFYTDDTQFERAWNKPREFIKSLTRYTYVTSPDFSVFLDLPRPIQMTNIFKNKALAAWWQSMSINVIPSISWTNIKHIEEDLDGWPMSSVIAINSTGIGLDKRAKHNWIEGYEATVDTLKPTFILRYGAIQESERAEISRYYPNANRLNLKLISNGRQRII